MKSVTKLKDDARKHEQKEEWDKAIQAYLLVLKVGEEGEGELDLPLYNRVGDLYLRLSKPNDAVKYYVQAADRYADAGLYNNAIALCNKALRYVPSQLDLLRKLGQFSASQGFLTDARRYFLEYAEKKFAAGNVDEALTALEEFAEVSGDPEVREMLARQLQTHGRTDNAVDELRKAHAVRLKNGDRAGADALRNEIEALAPGTMDVAAPASAPSSSSAYTPAPAADEDQDEGFAIDLPGLPPEDAEDTSLAGFESTAFEAPSADDSGDFQLQGFETTHAEPEVEDEGSFQLSDFESTAHEDAVVASDDLGLEPTTFEAPTEIDAEALPDLQFDDSSFGAATDDGHEDDGAFDLPLLGDDEDATSFDGDAGAGGEFALPGFEIETPSEDAGADQDDGGFELPMLGDDSTDDAEAATADSAADDGLSDLSFDSVGDGADDIADDSAGGGFDLGGLSVPTLTQDGAGSGGDDLPMLETDSVEDKPAEDLDDSAYEDFGEYRARPAGAAKEEPSDAEDPDQAFISDLMASAAPTEAEAASAAEEEKAAKRDKADAKAAADAAAQNASPGGWDPSALGFDDPAPAAAKPPAKPKGKAKDGTDYIDLGSFLTEDDDEDDNTRFRVQEVAPTGDEDRDFAELLSQFKQKVSENVSAEDSAAHYDLGLAFKEMGLVDEAIGEFQIAMRAGDMRLRVYEELGQCFLLKEQFNIAEKVLTRALTMQEGNDLEMIGVYYHLGRAYEGLGNRDAARDAYERVLGLDIKFQDVAARLKRL